jgi:hypothetical protein
MIADHSSDIQLAVHELQAVFIQRRRITSVGGRGAGDIESPEALVKKLMPLYCDDPDTVKAIVALLPAHIRTTVTAEDDAHLILTLISAFIFSHTHKKIEALDARCFAKLYDEINKGSMELSSGPASNTVPHKKEKKDHCLLS